MKTKALAHASTVLAFCSGTALASDTRFDDLPPEHFPRHNSPKAYASGANGRNQPVPGQPTFRPSQVPTYILPRELQWMNRPTDPSSGLNR